jgi:hypothetical protein
MVQQGITRRTGKDKEEEGKKYTALRTEGEGDIMDQKVEVWKGYGKTRKEKRAGWREEGKGWSDST